jgi:alcohol dehydrogenase class IV
MPQHTARTGVVRATRVALDVGTDLVVAVGGGSLIDTAKMTMLCMQYGMADEHLERLEDSNEWPQAPDLNDSSCARPRTAVGRNDSSASGIFRASNL